MGRKESNQTNKQTVKKLIPVKINFYILGYTIWYLINVLKKLYFSFSVSQIKCWLSGLEFTECYREDTNQTASKSSSLI